MSLRFSPVPGTPAAEDMDDIHRFWRDHIVPLLKVYIEIPNKSPSFDQGWAAAGHMDLAVKLFETWARVQLEVIKGATVEVVQLYKPDGSRRTPVILIEVPGTLGNDDTVLLYGHGDKQPEFEGWREGFGPWTPVLEDGKLYGRGGADDGYAMPAAICAMRLNHDLDVPRARQVLLVEFGEESGSTDLPSYIRHLAGRIGLPSLVVCLDSGCGDYERVWLTTSLRGLVGFDLKLKIMKDAVHSGRSSGIVPDLFRLATVLFARIQDPQTGSILCGDLVVPTPNDRLVQIAHAAQVLGNQVHEEFCLLPGVQPMGQNSYDRLHAGTWWPALTITGVDGLPTLENAGNTLPAKLTLRGSLRIPPTLSPEIAAQAVRDVLLMNPPNGVWVEVEINKGSAGWNSPPLAPWLDVALRAASQDFFGQDFCAKGEGGSIPIIALLGELFPDAQFVITGVLGPQSNAHGPNEFLHLRYAECVTACIARVLVAHAARSAAV